MADKRYTDPLEAALDRVDEIYRERDRKKRALILKATRRMARSGNPSFKKPGEYGTQED